MADDEHCIADTLRAILIKSGFEAAVSYDGQDAIDMARVWPPDIFLSDVDMPFLDGIEAAIQICKLLPKCRVLLFSGNLGTTELRRRAQANGHDFTIMQKPVIVRELLAHLRSILEGGGHPTRG